MGFHGISGDFMGFHGIWIAKLQVIIAWFTALFGATSMLHELYKPTYNRHAHPVSIPDHCRIPVMFVGLFCWLFRPFFWGMIIPILLNVA